MISDWQEHALKAAARWGLALTVLLVLIFLNTVPLRIAHLGDVRPAFMLMAVYYWAILRPTTPLAVFALGLVLDLLSAWPFGMNALVLVSAQALTAHNRKFLLGQSFLVIWAGFALVAFGAGAVEWALFSLFGLDFMPVKSALVSAILSALLFPLSVLPLAAVYKILEGKSATVP
jgi:rod shape-determining protein MreD